MRLGGFASTAAFGGLTRMIGSAANGRLRARVAQARTLLQDAGLDGRKLQMLELA